MASTEERWMPYEKTVTLEAGAGSYGLNELDGVFYSTMTTAAHYKQLKDFEARDDDIWLMTFPKSGTHWTWEMINMMKQQSAEISKQSFSILEVHMPRDVMDVFSKMPSPRTVVSHLPVDRVPEQLFSSKAKVIYVYRNPKDACLSLYHHFKKAGSLSPNGGFAGDLGDWVRILTSNPDTQMNRGQVDHVYGWLEKAKEMPDKILPVMFEDMKKDPTAALQKIAEFLGFPLSPELKSGIVETTEFEKMKTVKLGGDMKGFLMEKSNQKMFYRKGEVGGWKSELTVAQNETLDAFFNANPHYKQIPFIYSL